MSSFDIRDIRRAMDVYTLDNVYLGSVLKVVSGPVVREGEPVAESAWQSSAISGEMLGPAPTEPAGNSGPASQSARAFYAVGPDGADPIGTGTVVVGQWWGLRGRLSIPLDWVQTVSLERVVLSRTRANLYESGRECGQKGAYERTSRA